MREVEITQPLSLDDRQRFLLNRHSVLNALNVVVYQVERIGALLEDPALLESLEAWLLEKAAQLRDGFGKSSSDPVSLGYLTEIRAGVGAGLAKLRSHVLPGQLELFDRHLDNLEAVFAVGETRIGELIERGGSLRYCRTFLLDELRAGLEAAFTAMAGNSFGRYKMAFSKAAQQSGDYLMEFDLRSLDGRSLHMPAVVEDVVRDLAANARKYTDPGGWIRVSLVEEVDGLCLEVEDSGRGIPEDEIESVVAFGCRGSNFLGRAQTGGGFGLTKAYDVVREFGGRMWIRSAPGQGTRVRIRLPRNWPAPD